MITLLTIGQTPREDLMKPFNLEGVKDVQLIGVLDEASQSEIDWIEKQHGEEKLYVVLRNGMANVNHEIIEKKVGKLIKEYEDTSKAIAVLCMSEFNCTSNITKIIYPFKEMKRETDSIKKCDTTLIFVPIKEQLISAKTKWDHVSGEKHFVAVHPKLENVLDEINKKIKRYQPDHVILDCYGYDYELVAAIEKEHHCVCYNAQQSVVNKVKDAINE